MDTFGIGTSVRLLLVVRTIAPLVIAGISIWAVTDGGLDFKNPMLGWAAAGAMGLYALYNIVKLLSLGKHEVGISDSQVRVGSTTLMWTDVESAVIRPAIGMDTAILLKRAGGEPLKIAGATRNMAFIAAAVKQHVSEIDAPA